MHNNIILKDWHNTNEGNAVLNSVCQYRFSFDRQHCGLLHTPKIPVGTEIVSYKLFFTGKGGAGKTSTIMRLAGIPCSLPVASTHGIHKTDIYWPAKVWNKIIVFKLQCWEAGDNTLKKYSHIFPACREKADGIVLIFSHTDPNSFSEVAQNVQKIANNNNADYHPVAIVIGTRHSHQQNEALNKEIKQLEARYRCLVLRMLDILQDTATDDINEVSLLLNSICERLWIRNQEFIMKQTFDNIRI